MEGARINLYASIDTVCVTPFADDRPRSRAFTSILLQADGAEVTFMLDTPDLPAFAARLRETADAIESGRKVEIDKGYYSHTEHGWHVSEPLVIDGKEFARGYTVAAAIHEMETGA